MNVRQLPHSVLWGILVLCAIVPAHGQDNGPTSASDARAVIKDQKADRFTVMFSADEKTFTRTLQVTSDTTAVGLRDEWRTGTVLGQGGPELVKYDLRNKAANIWFSDGKLTRIEMHTACKEDYCPEKACAKKCGAKPCSCAGH